MYKSSKVCFHYKQKGIMNMDSDEEDFQKHCNTKQEKINFINGSLEIEVEQVDNILIPRPKPTNLSEFERIWKTTNPQINTSLGNHMYGEPTTGSLYKIWTLIQSVCSLNANDVLLDWGMGAGKILISKTYLSLYPNMRAIGVEKDQHVFNIGQRNINMLKLSSTRIFRRDSRYITTQEWEQFGCSIVLQYDGPNARFEQYHKDIMTALIESRHVRIIFSTKMTYSLFLTYFEHRPEICNNWKVYQLNNLSFGGSSFKGNLWVRRL